MNRCFSVLLCIAGVAHGFLAYSALVPSEADLSVATEVLFDETALPIDLSGTWTVLPGEQIVVPYSATGWGLESLSGDPTVRIGVREGVHVAPDFRAGIVAYDVASGLTGTGEVVVPMKVANVCVSHELVRDGQVLDGQTVCAYYRILGNDVSVACAGCDTQRVVRVDLREGVRACLRLSQVLPFTFSPTNYIGDVAGTLARVSVVELQGTSEDLSQWTPVQGTEKLLAETLSEGEIVWRARKGVWRATFEIKSGSSVLKTLTSVFDLRNARGLGVIVGYR